MHELGVRSALGARARDLRHLVLGDGLRQVGLGLLLGLTLATLLSRFLAAFLFGVERWDATVLVAVVGTIALAGLLAVRGPAVRAGRTDPATVLRGE
jgi:ABC-type antimicrobial peptide transport system permease subunit